LKETAFNQYDKKSLSNLNEIWFVDRGRWVLHVGRSYDPIQSQGHGGQKCGKMSHFTVSLPPVCI